jgi:Flp pilus assembly protein TadD
LHLLAVCAFHRRQYDIALEHALAAVNSNPNVAQLYHTLGVVYDALDKPDLAVAAYKRALSLKPDYSPAHISMAMALQSRHLYPAAIDHAQKTLRANPYYAEAHNAIGFSLRAMQDYSQAIDHFTRAIALKPDYAEAHNHLGVTLAAIGKHHQALDSYSRAIQIDPQYAEPHWNRALALLITGNLPEGWNEYQWRTHPDVGLVLYPHKFDEPNWDGSPFQGKTLLVHYERGLGDTIQFIRYLPMVKAHGGIVFLEVQNPLCRLLNGLPGVDQLLEASPDHKPSPAFDLHCSLMDLPRLFNTTLNDVPAPAPYIFCDPSAAAHWRRRIPPNTLRIGIVWAGAPAHEKDHLRSCRLLDFAPLARIEGLTLYSLQKDQAVAQLHHVGAADPSPALSSHAKPGPPVIDLAHDFHDLADTAAAIANLDLVISVDTCVLHLAAAMGKPAWALISAAPDWRWMLNRDDSPWYPTMRLFRQQQPGRWDPVFQQVAQELTKVVAHRPSFARRSGLREGGKEPFRAP